MAQSSESRFARARRTNEVRTEATRSALIGAARALFVEMGYAGTSTPDLVAAAGVTRGALYHHFVDKQDLFRHVLQVEAHRVRASIDAAAPATLSPVDALLEGGNAYLDAMLVPGRTRLLLIEGPAVLGMTELRALDDSTAGATLRDGLAAALGGPRGESAGMAGSELHMLSQLLSAAFDRAALEIDDGADAATVRAAMRRLLRSVLDAGAVSLPDA